MRKGDEVNKSIVTKILLVLLMAGMPSPGRAEMTADEVVRKMDKLLRGDSSVSTSTMEITNPNWKRALTMRGWSEGTKKFFIHILEPPREKNVTFLKLDNLLYQYLPSAEMRIKITPSMMLQSWMGSDFTNDDLVKESSVVNDYTHEMLRREKLGDYDCYVIKLKPKPEAPIVWDAIVVWVGIADYIPLKEEYYDEKGEKVRIMTLSDIRQLPDRKFPFEWTMVPLNKPGHKTLIRYSDIKFNVKVDPQVFTLKNLEKPR